MLNMSRKLTTRQIQRLDSHDTSSGRSDFNAAEVSRPYRQFKDKQREKKKKTGRPRTKDPTEAKYVNWMAPHLWPQIDAAARAVGYPWSPLEIVRRLQRTSPILFNRLRPQRICDWRDLSVRDRLVWKPSVLEQVKKGFAPQIGRAHV